MIMMNILVRDTGVRFQEQKKRKAEKNETIGMAILDNPVLWLTTSMLRKNSRLEVGLDNDVPS